MWAVSILRARLQNVSALQGCTTTQLQSEMIRINILQLFSENFSVQLLHCLRVHVLIPPSSWNCSFMVAFYFFNCKRSLKSQLLSPENKCMPTSPWLIWYFTISIFPLNVTENFLSLFSYLPLICQYFLSNLAVWKTQCCRCIPTSAIWSSQATFVHLAPTHWSFCSRVTCLICCPLAVQWSYGISEVLWKSSHWQSFRVGMSGCTHASPAFQKCHYTSHLGCIYWLLYKCCHRKPLVTGILICDSVCGIYFSMSTSVLLFGNVTNTNQVLFRRVQAWIGTEWVLRIGIEPFPMVVIISCVTAHGVRLHLRLLLVI